ncbi:MAG: hypothetical protein KatS3mg038_1411 [Candidatus Kapaibacterium sp.]|nr:MAG: hypothetical protein KatS3mg038_1293 [Candidatus Kapabacteria bacterium]GIV50890.1 MAG: hypothetical protein KatS3mg038_1411 [Candidatus Kapabacteria bacterium]
MADVYAISDGNWSDPTIWNSGVVPGTADNVWLNGKIITLDQDISVASISSEGNTTLGTIAAGKLIANTNRTINVAGNISHGGTTRLLEIGRFGQTVNLSAQNIYSSVTSGEATVIFPDNPGSVSPTLHITANLHARFSNLIDTGGYSSPTVIVNGNCQSTGSGYVVRHAIVNIIVNGNCYNGFLFMVGWPSGSITVNGNCERLSSLPNLAVINSTSAGGSGYVNTVINGDVIGGPGAVFQISAYPITINGNVYGGTSSDAAIIATGTVRVNGDVIAAALPAIMVASMPSTSKPVVINGNIKASIGSPSISAVAVPKIILSNSPQRFIEFWEADLATNEPTGNKLIFETNINASQANPADVRQGVVYGPAGEYTGTCAVPPPQSVAYGVPVDNTIGQAGLPPYRAVAEYRGG